MHVKLVRGMRGTLLANVVQRHIKVAHISPGSGTYLDLDEEMITRASIIGARSNLG